MNGFEFTLIYGVIVVFGILQIILFFKLWGMTNDVKAISNKMEAIPMDNYNKLEKAMWQLLLENKKEKAIEFLNCNLSAELIKSTHWGGETTDNIIQSIKNRYRKYYEKLGVPFPEQVEKINTLKDLEQLF